METIILSCLSTFMFLTVIGLSRKVAIIETQLRLFGTAVEKQGVLNTELGKTLEQQSNINVNLGKKIAELEQRNSELLN